MGILEGGVDSLGVEREANEVYGSIVEYGGIMHRLTCLQDLERLDARGVLVVELVYVEYTG